MARNRTITPDFWSWPEVIACRPMARLLFIGLWNFADDGGVQPLKPGRIRLQVFPGDPLDDDQVRAMIDELVARGLLRLYVVAGRDYLAIVDWAAFQKVGRWARFEYPADPATGGEAPQSAPSDAPSLPAQWRETVEREIRQHWPGHPLTERLDARQAECWTAKWIVDGCDLSRDVVPAVRAYCTSTPQHGPPAGFQEIAPDVDRHRVERLRLAGGHQPARAGRVLLA